jgi:hypothetical protein
VKLSQCGVRLARNLLTSVSGVQDGNKRRQSGAWWYQRRDAHAEKFDSKPSNQTEPVAFSGQSSSDQTGAKIDDNSRQPVLGTKSTTPAVSESSRVVDRAAMLSGRRALSQQPSGRLEPRRYHLSRRDLQTALGPVSQGGVSKVKAPSAVFVERRTRKKPSGVSAKLASTAQAEAEALKAASRPAAHVSGCTEPLPVVNRSLKRPGKRSATARQPPPSFPKPPAPTGDLDMERLAQEMHAYTLEQIGYTIAKQDEEHQREINFQKARARDAPVSASLRTTQNIRFKPRSPEQRWAERNPTEAAALASATAAASAADEEMESDSGSDEDYVMETYYRVPESVLVKAIPSEQIGVLVLDTDPEVEFFYGHESDSEEGAQDDYDEDENGSSCNLPRRSAK